MTDFDTTESATTEVLGRRKVVARRRVLRATTTPSLRGCRRRNAVLVKLKSSQKSSQKQDRDGGDQLAHDGEGNGPRPLT